MAWFPQRTFLAAFFLGFCVLVLSSLGVFAEDDRVCIGENCVQVETVTKVEDQIRGLQFRESMPADHGMLFYFDKDKVHYFWMKNTPIPLDILWIDDQKTIVHIEENCQPCFEEKCPYFTPSGPALYVLEVNAGYVRAHQIKTGDKVEFFLPSVKK